MTHHIIPLLLISNRDGYTEHRCLECNRPVSKQVGGWRHHPRIWRNTKRPM